MEDDLRKGGGSELVTEKSGRKEAYVEGQPDKQAGCLKVKFSNVMLIYITV